MKIAVPADELEVGDIIYVDDTPLQILALDRESGWAQPEGRVIRFVLPSGTSIVRGWWEILFTER